MATNRDEAIDRVSEMLEWKQRKVIAAALRCVRAKRQAHGQTGGAVSRKRCHRPVYGTGARPSGSAWCSCEGD